MTATNPAEKAANPITTVKWFIWDISSSTADLLFAISNALLVFAALAVFVGTIGSVTLSGVGSGTLWYHYPGVRELFVNGRLSANERATNEAQLGLANAQAGIAASNDAAAQAKLETERLKKQLAWRELTKMERDTLLLNAKRSPRSVAIIYPQGDAEAHALASEFLGIFRQAGWNAVIAARVPSEKLVFGISVSADASPLAETLRSVISAARIPVVPFVSGGFFTASQGGTPAPGAPTLMIGSKPRPAAE